ncbi:monooxygenase (plasmid) [Mycolicibacterium fluoranthenivorans]|uniref:Monooxygenase n=1 Tax=Mycolicibacterium fluoranthenivorans TaxID=258505 RepID=A0A7G8PQA8_9MYCO|nr:methane monooxygenase/ammonia monooxygenase subunit B [Mycolicibacterium fluoranthenivorans]QNJ96524.1 monooxygenase [Mycolicibacterium fluoranthenivorans]
MSQLQCSASRPAARIAGWARHLALIAIAVLVLSIGNAIPAGAHGEEGQQAFEKTATVTFYDVKFSTSELDIGQELTITGMMRVMESWPDHTLAQPQVGYLSINQPGPVFFVTERWMSDMFTPQSVNIHKGATYPFKIVAKARVPGKYHIHPTFAVHDAGTLVGPGQWVTIRDAGVFSAPVQLASGGTVDLSSFGLGNVVVWTIIFFVIAAAYLAFWMRKGLLWRSFPVSEGRGAAIISKRQVRISVAFAVVALLVGFGAYGYAEATTGPKIPPQVARVTPDALPADPLGKQLQTHVESAVFQTGTGRLLLTLTATNNSPQPVVLQKVQFGNYEAINRDVAAGRAAPDLGELVNVTPPGQIQPGETRKLTVDLDGTAMAKHGLLPLNEAQIRVTGVVFFTDPAGQSAISEVNELTTGILPQY